MPDLQQPHFSYSTTLLATEKASNICLFANLQLPTFIKTYDTYAEGCDIRTPGSIARDKSTNGISKPSKRFSRMDQDSVRFSLWIVSICSVYPTKTIYSSLFLNKVHYTLQLPPSFLSFLLETTRFQRLLKTMTIQSRLYFYCSPVHNPMKGLCLNFV